MKYLKFLLVLALGVVSTGVFAQLDKTHYIPPFFAPWGARNDAGNQWLVISTQEVVPFEVAISRGNLVYDTIMVSQSSPQLISLGSGYSSNTSPTGIVYEDSLNVVLKEQGYKLNAEYPFFTAVYQRSGAQGDVLTCKGETALGTEFYAGHIVSEYSSADSRRGLFVSVMAAFDNTSITISNSDVLYEGQTQNTITVTLDKNESYILGTSNNASKANGNVLNDFNGTKVTSNKPVAVNTGSWCGSANTGNAQDIGIDQLVPVNFVGNEYIAVKGEGTSLGEQIVVIATTGGTELYVNGALEHTFAQQGDYYIIGKDKYHPTNNNMYINADDNIYVYQTLSGQNSDVSVGLCFLPPLSCLSNREVNISYANKIGSPILSLVTELGAAVTINGDTIVEPADTVIGNSEWVTYQINGTEIKNYNDPPSSFEILSSKAINAALSFQSGVIGGAGYYSGFGISPVLQAAPTVAGTEACYPANAELTADGYDEYIWYFNGEVIPDSTSATLIPEHTGQYRVSGRTGCGVTKASDPYNLKTCLTLEGGGTFPEDEGDVMIILRLGLASEDDVSYWYRTQSATATEGEDFISSVGKRTIISGELYDTLYLSINDDNKYESTNESFVFDVYASENATVKNEVLDFYIVDNDPMPTVTAQSELTVEENGDSVTVSFVKNGATQDTLFFNYATQNGTASAGSEFTSTSGTLHFAPDEYIKYVYVPILDNGINNYAKDFALRYTDPESVTLVNTSTTVTINDDEETTTCLSILNVNADEGVEEGEAIEMLVQLENVEGIDITFQLSLNNMTTDTADFLAVADQEFTLKAGTVDTTFLIQTIEDTIPETNETFSYSLSSVNGARSCTGAIEFKIFNDDYIPTLDNDNFVMIEGGTMSDNVLTNDEILGDTPVVVVFTDPSSGNLTNNGDGAFSFTPLSDFFGVVDFTYSVTDQSGDSRNASVSIEVNNENDLPIANNDTIITSEDSVVLFFPMVNDIDVDQSSLALASVSGADLGSARVESDYIVYTPHADVFGKDTLTYFITDGEDDGATANIYLTINPANDIPLGTDDDYTLLEGDAATEFDVLSNDQDIDLSGISILRIYDVTGGTAIIKDDKVEYTLFDNFWGAASLSYTLIDAENDSASADVLITVDPVNDLPVAFADAAVTNEDEAVSIAVLSNDSDDDGRGLTLDSMSVPTNGSLSDVAGVITYTPVEDYCGADSFIYYISDYNDDVASAKVRVTINCMGEAPVATDDNYALIEDGAASLWDVMSNDVDKDHSGLTLTSVYGVTSGSAFIDGNKIRYTLTANFNGNAALNYVITDGEGDRDTASVTISVASVVDFPTAKNDVTMTNEDQSVDISPLSNDIDTEVVGFNVDSLGNAKHGTVVNDANVITYTPALNYCGSDSFAYRIIDGNGNRSTAWTLVTVDCVSDCPVANDDTYSILEDAVKTSYDVVSNDVDIDGDGFALSQVVSVTSGLAEIEGGQLAYTPAANFNGSATVKYEIRNASGDKDTSNVIFTITAVNDDPIAVGDIVVTNEDVQAAINVLSNDEDVDGSSLCISKIDAPENGTSKISGNNIVYIPEANYNGCDSFLYYIVDGEGDESQAMIVVTINSSNDAPITNRDTVYATEDVAQLFYPIGNDLDPDNGGLTMVNITNPANGAITPSAGQYLYSPVTDFNGVDSVLYTIKDAQGDQSSNWVVFLVNADNDLPVANNDLSITNEDEIAVVDVLNNDEDIDGSGLALDKVGDALHGTAVINAGMIEYTPTANYFGQDSFLYYIVDGEGDKSSAQINITVNSISDIPTAVNDSYVLTEDDAKTAFDVLANDVDADNGGLTLQSVYGARGGVALIESNKIAYVLDANYNGKDTLSYVLKDVDNDLDTAMVFLSVAVMNDTPLATNDTATTNEDNAIIVSLITNDVDIDASGISVSNIATAHHGTYTLSGNKITYTPESNYHGRDSFQYTITDGEGDVSSAQILLIINSVNDVPTALRDTVDATEDVALVFTPMANDTDPDAGGLSIINITAASHGAISSDAGCYTYTPQANYNGRDSVVYTIADAQGDQSMAVVLFRVASVNDVPNANNDMAITNEDASVLIDVLDNDDDLDASGLVLESVDAALHGTPSVVGNKISYQPNADFSGRDSFVYHMADAEGDKATATVVIVVNSGNDAPITAADYVNATEDVRIEFNPLSNDTDPDAGGLSISSFGTPKHGVVETESGKYYYTSNSNYNGEDSVIYTVADAEGDQSMNWIYFTVVAANDNPVAYKDQTVCAEDEDVNIDVKANDADIDNSGLNIESVGAALYGTTSIVDEKVTYVPDANFFGLDSFVYTIIDGEGDVSQSLVKVTVNAVSDNPIAQEDSYVVLEDACKTLLDVLSNDTDVDRGVLDIAQVYGACGGVTAIESNKIAYTPRANFYGKDTLIYVLKDAENDVDTSRILLTVTAQNDAPIGERDEATTSEDIAVEISVLSNDNDVDNSGLKVDSYDAPINGEVSASNNKLTYTPDANYFGRDSFMYYLSDAEGDQATAWVVVEVNSSNEAPVTFRDTVLATEDVAIAFDPMANDLNPDGGELNMLNMTAATNGEITKVGPNYIYTPDANFYGKDSISYTVADEQGDQSMSWVWFNIAAANDAPIARKDVSFTNEDVAINVAVLTNDTDIDLSGLSLDSVADAINGTAAIVGDEISYLPNSDYYGLDSFLYYIVDGEGDRSSALLHMTVNSVSDVPVAQDDAYALSEDGPKTLLQVLDNDIDKDKNGLFISEIYGESLGVAVIELNTIAYTSDMNKSGEDTLYYVVRDAENDLDTAGVILSIAALNDSPITYNDVTCTDEDQAVVISVLSNDVDVDNSGLSIDSVGDALHGLANITGSAITYTPEVNFFGADSFLYYTIDGEGDRVVAQVTVTVNAVSDYPVANADAKTISEDNGKVLINVLTNDVDVDLSGLTITDVKDADNGSVAIEGGRIAYTPQDNFYGIDTLNYIIKDGEFESDTATLIITVVNINDVPLAADDAVETEEDNSITIAVLANDEDIDRSILLIDSVEPANSGTTMIVGDKVVYTPGANFFGRDSFVYYIMDGEGDKASAEVKVSVTRVNEVPVATDDCFDLLEDAGETALDVLSNDVDIDNSGLTIFNVLSAQGGAVGVSSQQVVYTPVANFYGADTLTYVIRDGENDYDTARVYLNVILVNDLPQATDDMASTNEDYSVDINVLNNDVDIDLSGLGIDSVGAAHNGQVSFDANIITYLPEANYNGCDSFYYYIIDGEGDVANAMVSISVNAINEHPLAQQDSFVLLEDATKTAFDVLANDVDTDNSGLDIFSVSDAKGGVVGIETRQVVYTPSANFYGKDTLSYIVKDGENDFDTTLIYLDVLAQNDVPVAQQDDVDAVEDSLLWIDVLANDEDIDKLGISLDSVTNAQHGDVAIFADGVSYQPELDYFGADFFEYYIVDADGDKAQGRVNVNVAQVNDAPIATPDSFTVQEDAAATLFDVLANDLSIDKTALHLIEIFDVVGGVAQNSLNKISFRPTSNFYGEAKLNYVVIDDEGDKDTSWVRFDVTNVNDAPKANYDIVACQEDSVVMLNLLANDIDVDNSGLCIDSIFAPLHGEISTLNDTLYYAPSFNFCGVDSFTYYIVDGEGDRVASKVRVNVTCVNDAPVAVLDSVMAVEDIAKAFFPIANDIDPDNTNFVINFGVPANGSISNLDANYCYTSDLNFNGKDSVNYTITDVDGLSSESIVYFTVAAANDAPLANDDTLEMIEDSVLRFFPLANDLDVEDEAITNMIIYREPRLGSYDVNGLEITYTPRANVWGSDTLTYVVRDSANALSNVASIFINIASTNEVPVLSDLDVIVEENINDTTNVLTYAVDLDASGLTLISVEGASFGISSIVDNKLVYQPSLDFLGRDTVMYAVQDGEGDVANAEVYYNVMSFYEPPITHDDTVTTLEDVKLIITPTVNDMAAEKVAKCDFIVLQAPKLGNYVLDSVNVEYTPQANVWGMDTMTYILRDSNRIMSEVATIIISIDSVNESPIVSTVAVQLNEDATDTTELLSLASDPDFSGLTLTLAKGASNGISTVVGSRLAYVANADFAGMDTASFSVIDGEGDTTTSFVYYEVMAINDAPVAINDTVNTYEDNALVLSPLANDVDAEDAVLLDFTLLSMPTLGDVVVDSLNLIYTPIANVWGQDSLTYLVRDAQRTVSEEATIYITIDSVNEAPVLANVSINVTEDGSDTINVINMAQDPDFSGLTLDSVAPAQYGSASVLNDHIIYTPNLDFIGKDTVAYFVYDGENDTATAYIYYVVMPINDAPIANNDSVNVMEDDTLVISPLANDVDAEDSTLIDFTVLLQPKLGDVTLDSLNIIYAPRANVWGQDSMTYVVRDEQGAMSAEAIIYITIDSVNESPALMNINVNVTEDESDTTAVLVSARDLDFSGLQLAAVDTAHSGSVSIFNDMVVYEPQANFIGNDTVTYYVSDGENDTTSAYLFYAVVPVNDAPIAVNDSVNVFEDDTLLISPLANDVDAEDSVLIDFTVLSQPCLGTIVKDSLELIYIPQANVWGSDSMTYVVRDAQRTMSEVATIYITIDSVNEAPILHHLNINLTEDHIDSTDVIATASSPDLSGLFLAEVNNGTNGRASITGRQVVYVPNADFAGSDTVSYSVHDGENDTTEASIYYTVLPVNDAPVAMNDSMRTFEDNILMISPLSNDIDAEDTSLIDYTVLSYPSLGTVELDSVNIIFTPKANIWGLDSMTYVVRDAQRAMSEEATIYISIDSVNEAPAVSNVEVIVTEDLNDTTNVLLSALDLDFSGLTLSAIGSANFGITSMLGDSVIYTPRADFIGKDTVAYYVHDGENDTAMAYVFYRVIPINDAPVANDDTLLLIEDATETLFLLDNDTDAEDSVLNHFTVVNGPTMGAYTCDSVSITYTPNANVWGVDSLTYQVADCYTVESELATVYFYIDSVNESPILSNINVSISEDESDTTNVIASAIDPDFSGLKLAVVGKGRYGMAQILGNSIVYVPQTDFVGVDTVAYCVHDGENDTTLAHICYTVSSENDAPVAINDTVSTFEDNTLIISPLDNDVDAEDSVLIDFMLLQRPTLGDVVVDSLELIYTPQTNIWGKDSLTYLVRDAQGVMSEVATVYISIDSVNEAPVLRNIDVNVTEDKSDTTDVLTLALDPDLSGLTLAAVGNGRNGTATVVGRRVVYSPQANFLGADTVAYCVHDGENDTTLAYLCYNVIPVNDAPVANDDSIYLLEDISAQMLILANDVDAEDSVLFDFTVIDKPQLGTYTMDSVTLYYTPMANVWGVDSLTYQVADVYNVLSNVATVYFFIDSVNDAPIVLDASITIREDLIDTIDVLANAQSPDASALSLANVSAASNGQATIVDDRIVYIPTVDYNGMDSLSYTVVDGEGDSATAQLMIEVTFVNDAPLAYDDVYSHTIEHNLWSAIVLSVASNDLDPDLSSPQGQVVLDIQPKSGNVLPSVNPLEIVYTPTPGFVGEDSLAYHLVDTFGLASNMAWVNITVSKSATNLYAVNDTIVVVEDSYYDFNPIANDVETAGDSIYLKVDSVELKSVGGIDRINTPHGYIELFSDSIWHYNPEPNYYGDDTAYYFLANDQGDIDKAMIVIEVLPVNDAPVCEVQPTISGVVLPDSIMYCDKGMWNDVDGEISYSYQWFAIGDNGVISIASTLDSLVVGDSLLGADVYCEVTSTDNGYPLPGISVMSSSDTIVTAVYRPSGIVVSQDTIFRTWEDKKLVALLECEDSADGVHSYELMSGIDTFFIEGDKLYLDTAAYYIENESITLSIKVSHEAMGGLTSTFDVTFALIDDLMPIMKTNYPFIAEIFGDSVSVAVKADKQGSVYYEVQELGSIIPKAKDMHHAMKSSLKEEEEMLIGIGSLESQKEYEILIYLSDTSESHYSEAYVIPFSTVDVVAPIFEANSPYVVRCTEDSAFIIVKLDEMADVTYTLYENDMTVAASGEFMLDTAKVASQKLCLEHADNEYCIAIGGLRSQIIYQMVLSAEDTLHNISDDVELNFCTHDTVAPFFPGRRPYIKQIVDGRIEYRVNSSEEGTLYTRLAYASNAVSDFTAVDPLGLYSDINMVEENEVLTVETQQLTMDGNYRLDFALEDSAGNFSVIRTYEFTYPEVLGITLENTLIYQGDVLRFDNLMTDTQFEIITMNGSVLRVGTLHKDDPTVRVDYLNNGSYLIHVSNKWESRTFQFVKSIRQR